MARGATAQCIDTLTPLLVHGRPDSSKILNLISRLICLDAGRPASALHNTYPSAAPPLPQNAWLRLHGRCTCPPYVLVAVSRAGTYYMMV